MWRGETAFLVAGGPSLKGFDGAVLEGRRVITINDSYQLCPFAEFVYFCDTKWYRWHEDKPAFRQHTGTKVRLEPYAGEQPLPEPVKVLRNDTQAEHSGETGGLCLEPDGLRTGRNSGYQCINLAFHLGATRIVLLGYDMKPGEGGQVHWFGNHPKPTKATVFKDAMLEHFPTLVDPLADAGVEIINCTPGSAIECFPKRDLSDLLKPT